MNFGEALEKIKNKEMVTRKGWYGDHQLTLHRPVGTTSQSFIVICTQEGETIPWVASQTDLLAEDWRIVL